MNNWTNRLNSIGTMIMYCMMGLVIMNFLTGYMKDSKVDVILDMREIKYL